MRRPSSWIALIGLLLPVWAQQQPRCDKLTLGHFWPESANTDREVRQRAVRCGELEICTQGRWLYRWKTVSVPYWRMAGTPAPAACTTSEPEPAVSTAPETEEHSEVRASPPAQQSGQHLRARSSVRDAELAAQAAR